MECGQIFHFFSAASNAILKPGGLLRWKVRLVKDARSMLPLTEVMKIARFTSPLLKAPRQSLPRGRLRHGRRLAFLFHPNQTPKLYTLFFTLSLALLPRLPPLLISPRESASVYVAYLRSHFSVSQPKALCSRARSYLSEPRALKSLTRPFALPSLPLNFLRLPPTFPPLPTATGSDKVAYPILKHLPRSGMNFLHIFNLSWTLHLKDIFYYSHPQDGTASRLFCFLPAYLSHLLHIKAFCSIPSTLFSVT